MGKVTGPVEQGGPSGGSAVELLLHGVWGVEGTERGNYLFCTSFFFFFFSFSVLEHPLLHPHTPVGGVLGKISTTTWAALSTVLF